MTSSLLTEDRPGPGAPTPLPKAGAAAALRALATRLHFYAALFVGPFLLVAALSGALYAATPTLEDAVYDHELHAPVTPSALPLADQIRAAQQVRGGQAPSAVRPAPRPGDTTRVMFADPSLGESESHAVFVDPGTGEVRGELTVYGTSGVLPLRTWIDDLHRTLHLGAVGRFYSELAASWLWVIALAGLFLWLTRPRKAKAKASGAARTRGRLTRAALARFHGVTGATLLVGFLFLSASGLTWSLMAGDNISDLRASLGWSTPQLPTSVSATATASGGEHDHHSHDTATGGALDPAMYDHVLAAAHTEAFMDSPKVEIKPPAKPGTAWTVTEIDRGWPTQVDAVAVDPATMKVSGRLVFEDFPLAAKLTRWAVDAHMGSLFGIWNQLLLVVVALGLAASVLGGYAMWWKRRPTRGTAWALGRPPARAFISSAPWPLTAAVAAAAVGIGLLMPVLGISLAAFLAVDLALAAAKRRRAAA